MEVCDQARQWLAQAGYDANMGARPMARVIQEQLKKPLANELLFGRLTQGGSVYVSVKADKLDFTYTAKADKNAQKTAICDSSH